MLPVKRHKTQGAARQFGQRVMGDSFAAVEEKRDAVPAKRPRNRLMIGFQIANEHRTIAETILSVVSPADKFQNRARRKDRLRLRILASDYPQ